MWTHTLLLGIFLAAARLQNHLAFGLELDGHLSAIWERNSVFIHEIARKRACKDGRIPILTDMRSEDEIITYRLECEHILEDDTGVLDRRQTQTLCTSSCNRQCYHPADYNPDPKDCSKITASLSAGGGTFDVSVGGIHVSQYNTCIYTFTNQAHTTLNFCNSAWASIGENIAWECGRWILDPAKGGICSTTPFYVEAVRTPNMPGPSYTISFSTEAITRLDSTDPGSPSASTSTAQSSSSSGSSSSSTITSGTTSLPGPISSLNVSDIVIQTLSDEMTISLGSGQSSGGNEAGVTAEPSIGASPTNKQSTTAAAIGGTIGGIAFLALLIAVVAFHRRKKQRKALKTNSSELISPKEDQGSWAIPTNMPYMYEKRPRQDIPMVEPSVTSLQDTDAPLDESEVASSISPRSEPSYPAPHPRSTQALIAAAAPPNMSREQIDLLASNFISLVRGRPPGDDITEDGDASDLPPYHREWNS